MSERRTPARSELLSAFTKGEIREEELVVGLLGEDSFLGYYAFLLDALRNYRPPDLNLRGYLDAAQLDAPTSKVVLIDP
jgi:hypothetical protein